MSAYQWKHGFIDNEKIISLLMSNGFTCEKYEPKAYQGVPRQDGYREENQYQTNCPILIYGEYEFSDGSVIYATISHLLLKRKQEAKNGQKASVAELPTKYDTMKKTVLDLGERIEDLVDHVLLVIKKSQAMADSFDATMGEEENALLRDALDEIEKLCEKKKG